MSMYVVSPPDPIIPVQAAKLPGVKLTDESAMMAMSLAEPSLMKRYGDVPVILPHNLVRRPVVSGPENMPSMLIPSGLIRSDPSGMAELMTIAGSPSGVKPVKPLRFRNLELSGSRAASPRRAIPAHLS